MELIVEKNNVPKDNLELEIEFEQESRQNLEALVKQLSLCKYITEQKREVVTNSIKNINLLRQLKQQFNSSYQKMIKNRGQTTLGSENEQQHLQGYHNKIKTTTQQIQ